MRGGVRNLYESDQKIRTIAGGAAGATVGLVGSQLADAVLQHYAEDPEIRVVVNR